MLRKIIFVLLPIFTLLAVSHAREAQAKTSAELGPNNVWSFKEDGLWEKIHEKCGGSGGLSAWGSSTKKLGIVEKRAQASFIQCITSQMQKAGASPQAVAFTKQMKGEVYMGQFREMGKVDLAKIVAPTINDPNVEDFILVNGTPRIVYLWENVDKIDLPRDSLYPSLKRQYPNIEMWPMHDFVEMKNLAQGGQRFLFDFMLLNGCRGCDIAGSAEIAFDFDRNGKFKGTKLLKLDGVKAKNLANVSEGWPNLTKPLDITNPTQQFNTAGSTPPTFSPIPDTTDEQLIQFAVDFALAIVQKSKEEGIETVSEALLSKSIVAISKQLPAPLMKKLLLNSRGVIGWTARIVNKQVSMGIDPHGFALAVFSEVLVDFVRVNWNAVGLKDNIQLELVVLIIRETTVAYGAAVGGIHGAIAAQAIVTGKTAFEASQSTYEYLKEGLALRDSDKRVKVGEQFLNLRAAYLAESDPKVQCVKLVEIATFLAGKGAILIPGSTDQTAQVDKYVASLAQRKNLTCGELKDDIHHKEYLTTNSKLELDGIGPIRVGMTVNEASKAIELTRYGNGIGYDDCYYVKPKNGPLGIDFMVINNQIARIDINSTEFTTRAGARMGSTEAEILKYYPGNIEVKPHQYIDNGHYLIFRSPDARYQNYRLIFETDGTHVGTFRAGKIPEVGWVERCC